MESVRDVGSNERRETKEATYIVSVKHCSRRATQHLIEL